MVMDDKILRLLVVCHPRARCPISFSLSMPYDHDKLKFIGQLPGARSLLQLPTNHGEFSRLSSLREQKLCEKGP